MGNNRSLAVMMQDKHKPTADEFQAISGTSLSGIDVFADLKPAERQEIAGLCRGRRYQPEQVVVSHLDENNRDVFFIISGTVRVTIYSLSGKEITFRDQMAGQMFGELSAIDGRPRSAHVLALTESTLAFMSPGDFWKVVHQYPAVAAKILKNLTNLIRLLSERVIEFSVLGVNNRIHAELLRLAREDVRNDGTAVISPAPTHAEIASRVSTHREAVSRELSALGRSGLLAKQANALLIQDIERLEKMVHEVLGD